MKIWFSPLLLLVALGPSESAVRGPTPAPVARIHELADGTLVEGVARQNAESVRIESPFGTLVVSPEAYRGATQVRVEDLSVWYRGEAEGLSRDDVPGHRALGERCRAAGYLTGLRRELNAILSRDTDDSWARMILRGLARDWSVHRLERETGGTERRKFVDYLFEDLAVRDNTGAVMAAEKLLVLSADDVFRPAMKSLKHDKPRVRWLGAHVLRGHRGKPERVQQLFRRSLQDGVWAVRREAVRSLKAQGDKTLVPLYARQLGGPEPIGRIRAAQALAELGEIEAAASLVQALADSWQPTHNHIAVVTQVAYVKDYDVEVAQSAFIADPIVDVVQDGAVLDAAVISISIVRRVYRDALTRLTGVDLGTDAGAWRRWLENR
jgi:hypothetical protein